MEESNRKYEWADRNKILTSVNEEKLASNDRSQPSSIQASFLAEVFLFLPPAMNDADTCKQMEYLRSEHCSLFVVLLIRIAKVLTNALKNLFQFLNALTKRRQGSFRQLVFNLKLTCCNEIKYYEGRKLRYI